MQETDWLSRAQQAQDTFIADLSTLVNIDSGSDDPAGVNRVCDWVAARLTALSFSVERREHPGSGRGDSLIGRLHGTGTGRLLMFAHMDTVFARGTAAARPFSIDEDGHAHGPGVTDDKAGIVTALHTAAHLRTLPELPFAELILVFTPDEEVGSAVGGPVLQEVAAGVDAAFCLECARANGDLVLSRKGCVDFTLTIDGVAAHSGIEPERGAHAGLEAAHLTVFLQQLADPAQELTVNAGVIRAGERTNIVPDRAVIHGEMRANAGVVLDSALGQLRARATAPVVAGTTVALEVTDHCPPLEVTPSSQALGTLALQAAAALGFTPGLVHTGGVSDGNRVAQLGVPTLDGMGPVGGDDHAPTEWLDLASVPYRVALLLATVEACCAALAAAPLRSA